MTQLDVLFDFLTELIPILTRHSHIAQHDVRFFGPHLFERRVGIKTGYQLVIVGKQQAHVIDDFGVIVNNKDCRTVIIILMRGDG